MTKIEGIEQDVKDAEQKLADAKAKLEALKEKPVEWHEVSAGEAIEQLQAKMPVQYTWGNGSWQDVDISRQLWNLRDWVSEHPKFRIQTPSTVKRLRGQIDPFGVDVRDVVREALNEFSTTDDIEVTLRKL